MYTFDCQGDKNMEKNNGKEKRARELFAKEVQEEKANKGWNYNRNLLETSIDSLVTIGPDGIITCLLYTSDAADEEDSVDLGGRRIIKKKKRKINNKISKESV